jgi:isopentenyl-diphosphate Delta-isomerase
MANLDTTSVSRKQDHIALAFASQTNAAILDQRFYYEPMLASNACDYSLLAKTFLDKSLAAPIWVSSMTGGTNRAATINENLAKACNEFGLGMGLGSCRSLLYSDDYLADFSVRNHIGDQPLYANLGIAQVEKMIDDGSQERIIEMIKKLEADGLIIHVNPLQEYMQEEGDIYTVAPIDTIKKALDLLNIPIIVKEVGHGFGIKSMEALLALPLAAVEFAAFGGTNFTVIELSRKKEEEKNKVDRGIAYVGHTAEEMVAMANILVNEHPKIECQNLIISGGVGDFLDGYYLIKKSNLTAVYGQASSFLKHAMGDYRDLQKYVQSQIDGLALAHQLLTIKS